MDINNVTKDGVTVISICGNLDSNTCVCAQDNIMPLVEEKCCLVLNLTECKYISSAGLRVLLMIAKELQSRGGSWALAGICEEVKDVMEMTGFSGFFKSYSTVEAASKSLRGQVL